MERKSFIIYADYETYFRELSANECKETFLALFEYARTGQIPELTGMSKMAFLVMKNNFDRDDEKYQKMRQTRSKAGKKGGVNSGKARKAKASTSKANKALVSNDEANETNEADNVNDNVNANVNVNDNDNVNANVNETHSVSQGNRVYKSSADATESECSHFSDEFEELWQMYPKERRQGKKQAYGAYTRARKKGVTFDEMKKALSSYIEQIRYERTDSRYIKQAVTWFSGEPWKDEYNTGLDSSGEPLPRPRILANGVRADTLKPLGTVI